MLSQLAIKAYSYFTLYSCSVHNLQCAIFFPIMEVKAEDIRHILFYNFNKSNNMLVSTRNNNAVNMDRMMNVTQCKKRFQIFRAGNNSLEDTPRLL